MAEKQQIQRIFIIRHGERLDNVDYEWELTAERPYDPPLTDDGTKQAFDAGLRFKDKSISCIISSPFLRCMQTAQQICNHLQLPGIHTCNGIVDVMNGHCRIHEQPLVPAGDVVQHGINVLVYHHEPLPTYPERTRDGLKRFSPEFNNLADEHWPKNIVIVTHGYGVCQAVAMTQGKVYHDGTWVDYCGHVELSRKDPADRKWTLDAHQDVSIPRSLLKRD